MTISMGLEKALAQLWSAEVQERTNAGAEIRDLLSGYGQVDPHFGQLFPAVAGVLVVRALAEQEEIAREEMLNALADICVRASIPLEVVAPLQHQDPVFEWEQAYIDEILSNAAASGVR